MGILTQAQDAVLEMVHVVGDDRPRRIVDHKVNTACQPRGELARRLKDLDGVSCNTQTAQDDPFAAIVTAGAKASPDLLLVGPHRRQIVRDTFFRHHGQTPDPRGVLPCADGERPSRRAPAPRASDNRPL
jgi:hypothetical protein